MDGVSGSQLAANGIMSFALLAIMNAIRGLRAHKLRGIVAPLGKTTLSHKLSDDSCYIIDLDAYLSENMIGTPKKQHPKFLVLQIAKPGLESNVGYRARQNSSRPSPV